jgi:L-alanine-DL-glutamate epimerase-like enolase superfamily enzyme
MTDLVKEPLVLDPANGEIELSERPGLGIELNPETVERFRVS